MTARRQKLLMEKIRRSRARLMVRDPSLAMVLMYMRFVATKNVQRISTNGRVIYFDPDWLQKLSGISLDYMLSHQVIHIVLEDTKRPAFFAGDRYHHACDIIACSVLRDRGWLCDELPQVGRLPHKTYFPGHEGNELMPLEAYREVPFDPSALSETERRRYRIDSDEYWGRGTEMPEGATLILQPGIDNLRAAPEEESASKGKKLKVMVPQNSESLGEISEGSVEELPEFQNSAGTEPDDYSEELDAAIDRLLSMIEEMEKQDPKHQELLERIWKGVGSSRLEWKRLLASFLQEELNDYSFTPPDRRFADSGFFLPDFNQSGSQLKNLLFMVDSSGSIGDNIIAQVYEEICAAIEQFDGCISGKLSFFDTQVTSPAPFSSIQQLLKIRPKGQGGTDFECIFRYIARNYVDLPSCIVIFTDGEGEYPPEHMALGVPVIWIIYGKAKFPAWGKTARIIETEKQRR